MKNILLSLFFLVWCIKSLENGIDLNKLEKLIDSDLINLEINPYLVSSLEKEFNELLSSDIELSLKKINKLMIVDDKKTLVVSHDSGVDLIDLITGKFIKRLSNKKAISLAYDSNNNFIIIGFFNGAVKIWCANSLIQLFELQHAGPVFDIAIDADRGILATASGDCYAKMWNLSSLLYPLEYSLPHDDHVITCKIINDYIITGSLDDNIRIWDINTGQLKHELFHRGFRAMAISNDSSLIATGSMTDKTIRIWNLENGSVVREIEHNRPIEKMVINKEDYLITSSRSKIVDIWDLRTGELLHKLDHGNSVSTILTGGRIVILGAKNGLVKIWNMPVRQYQLEEDSEELEESKEVEEEFLPYKLLDSYDHKSAVRDTVFYNDQIVLTASDKLIKINMLKHKLTQIMKDLKIEEIGLIYDLYKLKGHLNFGSRIILSEYQNTIFSRLDRLLQLVLRVKYQINVT